jgi:hypothetical protein
LSASFERTLASAERPCFRLSPAKALAGNTALAGDLLRLWRKRVLKGSARKQAAGECYRVLAFTACGIRLTAQWRTPVFRRKFGRNTGHTSAETNKVYTHHELESLRTAIAVIPRIGGK